MYLFCHETSFCDEKKKKINKTQNVTKLKNPVFNDTQNFELLKNQRLFF